MWFEHHTAPKDVPFCIVDHRRIQQQSHNIKMLRPNSFYLYEMFNSVVHSRKLLIYNPCDILYSRHHAETRLTRYKFMIQAEVKNLAGDQL